jgi:hypothetical protein
MGYGFTPILKNPHQMRVWEISTKFFPEWGIKGKDFEIMTNQIKKTIGMLVKCEGYF